MLLHSNISYNISALVFLLQLPPWAWQLKVKYLDRAGDGQALMNRPCLRCVTHNAGFAKKRFSAVFSRYLDYLQHSQGTINPRNPEVEYGTVKNGKSLFYGNYNDIESSVKPEFRLFFE